MKKVLFMVMAAAAISFASCGGNKNTEAPADETEQVADFDVDAAMSNLQTQLESGDASALQKALEAVKEQVAKLDPAVAKEYVAKVQDFLKENAEKVKEVVGDNAVVTTLVSSIVETPAESLIESVQQTLGNLGQAGQEAAEATADQAKQAAENAVDNAKQAVEDKANEAANKANEAVNKQVEKANEAVDKAKEDAGKEIDKAADKVKKGLGL